MNKKENGTFFFWVTGFQVSCFLVLCFSVFSKFSATNIYFVYVCIQNIYEGRKIFYKGNVATPWMAVSSEAMDNIPWWGWVGRLLTFF